MTTIDTTECTALYSSYGCTLNDGGKKLDCSNGKLLTSAAVPQFRDLPSTITSIDFSNNNLIEFDVTSLGCSSCGENSNSLTGVESLNLAGNKLIAVPTVSLQQQKNNNNIIRYDIHRWYHRPRGSHGGPNVSSVPTWLQGVQRRPAMLPWVYDVSQGGFRMLCASYVLALVRFAAKKAMDAPSFIVIDVQRWPLNCFSERPCRSQSLSFPAFHGGSV